MQAIGGIYLMQLDFSHKKENNCKESRVVRQREKEDSPAILSYGN
jgi:hypothetical protein